MKREWTRGGLKYGSRRANLSRKPANPGSLSDRAKERAGHPAASASVTLRNQTRTSRRWLMGVTWLWLRIFAMVPGLIAWFSPTRSRPWGL